MTHAPAPVLRWSVLLALLAGAGWLAMFGDKTPVGVVSSREAGKPTGAAAKGGAASTAGSRVATARVAGQAASQPERIEPLALRAAWFEPPRPPAADLFARAAWHVPMPVPTRTPSAAVAAAPAPVLPPKYKVAGKQHDGHHWEVFLLHDENTFVVRSGQVLESTWRVEQIEPPSMTLVHLPTGQQHRLAIGDPL